MRLDQAIVAAGLAESRARAQQLIAAGVVTVAGRVVTKASSRAAPDAVALTENPIPWVSRAALKLLHGLDHWSLVPSGTALDIGASTGGFTEVLLARGASEVIAVDVGRDQMHPSLRHDPRVDLREGLNAKDLLPVGPVDWLVSDVSFISLTKALPRAMAETRLGGTALVLVKPQFEVGRAGLSKGGVVKGVTDRAAALSGVVNFFKASGWAVRGTTDSPILGGDGNHEFLLWATKP